MNTENLTVELRRPVNFEGIEIKSLTMRELTVKEVLALEKSNTNKPALEQEIHYFAMMCGVAPGLIHELGERDWKRLRNRYWETLGNVEQEGENSE